VSILVSQHVPSDRSKIGLHVREPQCQTQRIEVQWIVSTDHGRPRWCSREAGLDWHVPGREQMRAKWISPFKNQFKNLLWLCSIHDHCPFFSRQCVNQSNSVCCTTSNELTLVALHARVVSTRVYCYLLPTTKFTLSTITIQEESKLWMATKGRRPRYDTMINRYDDQQIRFAFAIRKTSLWLSVCNARVSWSMPCLRARLWTPLII
jgi:hypothetical protein